MITFIRIFIQTIMFFVQLRARWARTKQRIASFFKGKEKKGKTGKGNNTTIINNGNTSKAKVFEAGEGSYIDFEEVKE